MISRGKAKMLFIALLMFLALALISCGSKVKVGDIISFGNQEWIVLERQGKQALIISKYVLELRSYHDRDVDITWEDSSIRGYLNDEFYNNGFTEDEKLRIVNTKCINANNQWFNTPGGNETIDKIFLLSIDEVVKYFGDSEDLKNKKGWDWDRESGQPVLATTGGGWFINDQYNEARKTFDLEGEAYWWWLRSPGRVNSDAACVDDDGYLDMEGYNVGIYNDGYNSVGAVRPAMWINL